MREIGNTMAVILDIPVFYAEFDKRRRTFARKTYADTDDVVIFSLFLSRSSKAGARLEFWPSDGYRTASRRAHPWSLH